MKHLRTSVGPSLLALAGMLSAAHPVAAQQEDQEPPRWISDAQSGCKIWDPAPEPNETVRWSGKCENGYATGDGVLQWYENGRPGDRYEGEYQGGKRNGHGVVVMSNGRRVEGDWRDDELLQMGVNEI
jgi:hypothetical protein